jgi:hypothetical protein
MNLFLFVKYAIDIRATQNMSRLGEKSLGLTRKSPGLNLLSAQNTGKQLKPVFSSTKPTQLPLLGPTGPKSTPNNSNFPYIKPTNSVGTRTISNPLPSTSVRTVPNQ